ncbi:MAG: exodeoxyribonuclease VII small subunit [Hyphomonadaceae bacterium]|nr:exodeoxyribonuclease VII small subunit [Hyphomonadaceae bacterium]MBC6412973.1 exodeoxyribonuclease VII small subunit [Hyphomonadaceae bacterium]
MVDMPIEDMPIEDMSFEDALKELEEIVRKLERGDAPLEKSIEIYQRGAKLKAHCEGRLRAAQLKVEKVVLDVSGRAGTEPFDAD